MLDQAPILVLNHLLKGANWARLRLRAFAGRRARIAMPPLSITFEVMQDGYLAAAESEPEVVFSLPPGTPLLALKGVDALVKEAHVSGPADFADTLGLVLRNLRWDAEEDLSRIVGDIAAHRLAGFGRRFLGWQQHVMKSAAENATEYLLEERAVLPARSELKHFAAETDSLREDLARLEARIARLSRHP